MMQFYDRLVQNLGLRQRAYQSAFGTEAARRALIDLAEYSRAFAPDDEGLTHDQIIKMNARRQMFFRIFQHIKLSPAELEMVCKDTLVHTAVRIQQARGIDE